MLRIFGDRQSLLAALSWHWSYELIQLDQPFQQRSKTTWGCPVATKKQPLQIEESALGNASSQ